MLRYFKEVQILDSLRLELSWDNHGEGFVRERTNSFTTNIYT